MCGATKNLHLDHKERGSKEFTICSKIVSVSEAQLVPELEKCQLLCIKHHQDKTFEELGFKRAKGFHGTASSYRYCHCDLCRKATRDQRREAAVRDGRVVSTRIPAVHGSGSMYSYRGCRCSICRKGQTDRARVRRVRLKQMPP